MKIFLSYACTGEDQEELTKRLTVVRSVIESMGNEVYCFHFDEARTEDADSAKNLLHALSILPKYDLVIAIVTSPRRSEGMLIEIGAALTRSIPVTVALHESALGSTYLPDLAGRYFLWTDETSLTEGVRMSISDGGHDE